MIRQFYNLQTALKPYRNVYYYRVCKNKRPNRRLQLLEFSTFKMAAVNFKGFFDDYCNHLNNIIRNQLKDTNKMKSSFSDPHKRVVTLNDIHSFAFNATVLSASNLNNKMDGTTNNNGIIIKSLDEAENFLHSANLLKFHASGDLSIVTPWAVVTKEYY